MMKNLYYLYEEDEGGEDEQHLSWSMNILKGSKGKRNVIDSAIKVARFYSTKGFEKRLIEYAMKSSKSSTTKRRRLNKDSMVEIKENIKFQILEKMRILIVTLLLQLRREDKKFI